MSNKQFKPYVSPKNKKSHFHKDVYVMTCDMEHHLRHKIKGTDIELVLNQVGNLDHRQTHPTIGKVISSNEGSQFKVDTEVICNHYTFENHMKESEHFYTDINGDRYFKVSNFNVMFGIIDGELVPREGVLLCEAVDGKFTNTLLEMTTDNEGRRRDIAKVIMIWEGCTEYKVGDYVMLKYGADYPFTFKGKNYIKVDHYFNDIYAISDTAESYDSVIKKHVKHNKGTATGYE